ncbi:hypothetical protein JW898_05490 [Candidatus Woesearchaeota archaeon]|nr:hypothetical protein [Candidatus Woesearchaeota archaeon]
MKEIAIIVKRGSEEAFYTLLAGNSQVPLKHLCRKVPRKMLYKYLSNLKLIQDTTGIEIFQKRAVICPVTGFPNIVIERKCSIKVGQAGEGTSLVLFGD